MSEASGIAPARDSILDAVDAIGDAWSWLILREAVLHRVDRFGEFQDRLGIARSTLTARLNQLDRSGILIHDPQARRYALSPAGEDFFGCLLVAQRWGDRWRPNVQAALPVTHEGTAGARHAVSAILCCTACGQELRAGEVIAHRGSGAFSNRVVATRRRTPDLELLERVRPCSIAHTLTVTGDWWSFLIIRELFFGVHRFDDLQRHLGVGPNILSTRLRNLVSLGVVDRVEYQSWPARYEYRLSEKGLDYYPIPLAVAMWGRRWLPPNPNEPTLTHACGGEVQAVLRCAECTAEITRQDVDIVDRWKS
ncbi:winged helix-turn-helix transcriptional regulator [Mycobacterium sp. 134]|uniref:winged helix-turn-helix transcriptional regulator n=1 Tax=Mycobacterium sp. 134 TaxID=3400425 RepID=UPI003AAA8A72